MALGDGGTAFSLTLRLQSQQRLETDELQFASKRCDPGLHKEARAECQLSPRKPFSPRQRGGELRGLPLSPAEIICWDQVGVTPAINTRGELLGQEGQQRDPQPLTSPSLISSFPSQIECLPACFEKVNPVCLKLVQSPLQMTYVPSSIDTHSTNQCWDITVASLQLSLPIPGPIPATPLIRTEAVCSVCFHTGS